jgi:voltage-gated potassium channel
MEIDQPRESQGTQVHQSPQQLPLRRYLKRLVEDHETKGGRRFTIAIQILILVSVVSFSIETLPNLSPEARSWLHIIEIATVAIFTFEYLLRLWVADRAWRYIVSFWGIVDLVAILPFYLSLGIDLRGVRGLRMLRVFRLLKFARYQRALSRFGAALNDGREELIIFLAAAMMTLYVAAIGIYYFERDAQPETFRSIFDGLWWAIATLTTVGYGDVYPVTAGGRFFTSLVLLIGLGIIAVPTGIIASSLSKIKRLEAKVEPERTTVGSTEREKNYNSASGADWP